ncbi:hypothetical protein [Dokdonia sp.]|uniref:hypothetical protein n=1 Tax=Dokdonia sp. TaxID=2024995 RepID=UPI00326573A1
MKNFLTDNWQAIIITIIAPVVAFFAGKKNRKIGQDKAGASALTAMQESYAKWVEDQEERHDFLKDELKTLQNSQEAIKEELKMWKEKYTNLQKEFNTYKTSH